MLCSVYREEARQYDYYRCPNLTANTRSGPVGILSAIPKLPRGATKVGSGEVPVGVVVAALDGWEWSDSCWWLLLAVGALAVLRKRG
jgi:hypothetical protein